MSHQLIPVLCHTYISGSLDFQYFLATVAKPFLLHFLILRKCEHLVLELPLRKLGTGRQVGKCIINQSECLLSNYQELSEHVHISILVTPY